MSFPPWWRFSVILFPSGDWHILDFVPFLELSLWCWWNRHSSVIAARSALVKRGLCSYRHTVTRIIMFMDPLFKHRDSWGRQLDIHKIGHVVYLILRTFFSRRLFVSVYMEHRYSHSVHSERPIHITPPQTSFKPVCQSCFFKPWLLCRIVTCPWITVDLCYCLSLARQSKQSGFNTYIMMSLSWGLPTFWGVSS